MNEALSSKLEFSIFSAHTTPRTEGQIELHNQVYQFWLKIWKDVFTQSNSMESLDADDFFRQQYVKVITHNHEVVACNFSTVFNLKNNFYKDHSYFSSFTPFAHGLLAQRNCQSAMSVEYITSHPEWRKKDVGFSLGAVLLGLDMKLLHELKIDVALGAPRKDLKVNDLCANHGWETLIPSVSKCKYDCAIMAGFKEKLKPYPDQSTEKLIRRLWNEKNDFRFTSSIFDMHMDGNAA